MTPRSLLLALLLAASLACSGLTPPPYSDDSLARAELALPDQAENVHSDEVRGMIQIRFDLPEDDAEAWAADAGFSLGPYDEQIPWWGTNGPPWWDRWAGPEARVGMRRSSRGVMKVKLQPSAHPGRVDVFYEFKGRNAAPLEEAP